MNDLKSINKRIEEIFENMKNPLEVHIEVDKSMGVAAEIKYGITELVYEDE